MSEEEIKEQEELRNDMDNLNEKLKILDINVKKMNVANATMRAHYCKDHHDMCADLKVLGNGLIHREA